MKTKKVEKVIATLKDRIGHPLKRYFTETLTWVNNLKVDRESRYGAFRFAHVFRKFSDQMPL